MNEQNDQNFENQEVETENGTENTSAENTGGAKKILEKIKALPKKVWIISAIALVVITAIVVAIILIVDLANEPCLHNFTETIIQEDTCGQDGKKLLTCSICGWSYEEIYNDFELAHDWEAATCTSPRRCKNCYAEEGYSISHQIENITCTSKGSCKFCGLEGFYYESHQYSKTDGACTVCGGGVKFILPQSPIVISTKSGSTLEKTCKIESIKVERVQEYSYMTPRYELTFIVESTYHKKGDAYSDDATFGWKLYDEDGLVVTSGTGYTDASIKVGEKSKEVLRFPVDTDSDDVQDGKTYRLELLNIG